MPTRFSRIAAPRRPAILLLAIYTSLATSAPEPDVRSAQDTVNAAPGQSRHVVVTLSQDIRNEADGVVIAFGLGNVSGWSKLRVEPDLDAWPSGTRELNASLLTTASATPYDTIVLRLKQ